MFSIDVALLSCEDILKASLSETYFFAVHQDEVLGNILSLFQRIVFGSMPVISGSALPSLILASTTINPIYSKFCLAFFWIPGYIFCRLAAPLTKCFGWCIWRAALLSRSEFRCVFVHSQLKCCCYLVYRNPFGNVIFVGYNCKRLPFSNTKRSGHMSLN